MTPAGFAVAACVLLLLGWGSLVAMQAVFHPWSRSLIGGPTLTGAWLGELVTPTGKKQLVWFEIEPPYRVCANCPTLSGEASTCDRRGPALRHWLSGRVANWRGTQFTLKLTEFEEGASALRLAFLEGSWHGDRLDLTTTLIARGQPIGTHPDTRMPIAFAMHRATQGEFEAACGRLTSASTHRRSGGKRA
jgi:hypothetical protein